MWIFRCILMTVILDGISWAQSEQGLLDIIMIIDELLDGGRRGYGGAYGEPSLQSHVSAAAPYGQYTHLSSPLTVTGPDQPSYGFGEPKPFVNGYNPPIPQSPAYIHTPKHPAPSYIYGHRYLPKEMYRSSPTPGYGSFPPSGYGSSRSGYDLGRQTKKTEKVYVPVVLRQKKKKMKIIVVQKGFYINGGTQLFGKFKTLKSCQKACASTPNCFAGDYNPWLRKCYIHSNFTACSTLRAHKKLVHFKKIPCDFPEAPMGRVMLGTAIPSGLEQKGVKSLSGCLKHCATVGVGIQANILGLQKQLCYGIDYDFGSHKCFLHVDNNYPAFHFCPMDGSAPPVPRDATPNHAVVSILLCPGPV